MAQVKKKSPVSSAAKARLHALYDETLKPELQKTLGIANIHAVPEIEKIVLNVGVKEAVADSRVLNQVMDVIGRIAGQLPVKKEARKSIAGFKIREGMPIGVSVTLRRKKMYEFLDRLINLALPNVRDFQGVSPKFDGRGNYNLGIKEWSIFPEADTSRIEKVHGLNVTICTSSKLDAHAYELLKSFGMPFSKGK